MLTFQAQVIHNILIRRIFEVELALKAYPREDFLQTDEQGLDNSLIL